ncbi:MAG: hypothetical protein PSY12_14815 [bacterium]|nr:hypothetical protein [bacterium]
MIFSRMAMVGLALAAAGFGSVAHAEGLGAEVNYGRADGHWGTEVGAGYALGLSSFSLTPGAGVYLRDGGTRVYGRVEASYAIPLLATIGAGVRVSDDSARPYATIAMPLLPKLRVKGNVGPNYYAVGLTLGY